MLQINWSMVACFFVLFFAVSGFSRGWWKEAVTTVVMAILIFLLQNPDVAETFISVINQVISWVWNITPDFVITMINDVLLALFGFTLGLDPFQFEASSPNTWLMMLAFFVVGSVLLGRLSFDNKPTGLGKLFGTVLGAVNGFLILSLGREYLDGRALPGLANTSSEVTLAGSSQFGAASPAVSMQVTNMPAQTILDSAIPWVLIGVGLLFLFSVFRTRVKLDSNQDGRKIITQLPPFYVTPPPPPKKKGFEDFFQL